MWLKSLSLLPAIFFELPITRTFFDFPWRFELSGVNCTSVFVDGSPIGLGAVQTQKDVSTNELTPLHYANCPLTPTQARYLQIDREALSVFWAIKRFYLFLYEKNLK